MDHWWRVTPDAAQKDDVCVGSLQTWANVLPVFIEADLLRAKSIDGMNYDLNYNSFRWEMIKEELDEKHGIVMHLSPYRPKKKKTSYYFCIQKKKNITKEDNMMGKLSNQPQYSGPAAQKTWESKNPRSEHISERVGRRSSGQLGRKLKEYRKQVQSDFSTAAWNDMVDAVQKLGGILSSDVLKIVKESSSLTTTDAASAAAAASPTSDDADETIVDDNDTNSNRNQYEDQVKAALDLNFDIRMANDKTLRPPRPNAKVKDPVKVRNQKQADERMRFSAVALAEIWGYSDPTRPYDDRQQIANAACRQVAYDQGFPKSTGGSQLHKWRSKLLDGVVDGKVDPIGREKVRGRVAYTEKIEKAHPGYLHELYRYATLTKGAMATFQELADCMNSKSATAEETRMNITLHSFQLYRWWKKNGGKEKSSIEKPKLTKEHCRQRLEWIEKWAEITTDPNAPVAYLDEKWFYTRSRRRKIKLLPLSSHEEKNTANLIALRAAENSPKIRSRRYPVKVMYLGVVAQPRPDKSFNGRIMLKRVANTKKVEAKTRNELFSTDVKINCAIRYGDELGHKDWYDLHANGMTAEDLCDSIAQFYELSEFVSERLEFHFPDYNENGEEKKGQYKYRVVEGEEVLSNLERFTPESEGQKVKVELKDLRLAVRYKEGDTVTRDVNCNSKWMLDTMDEVGEAIRKAYSWVPAADKIYLVMDNAGGHGTKTAVGDYTKQLLDKHNIEIIQQVPRSPETNVLDLGIWMSLQSAVLRRSTTAGGAMQML